MNIQPSRICLIVAQLYRARKRGATLRGNSAFERELSALINAPDVECPLLPGETANLTSQQQQQQQQQ